MIKDDVDMRKHSPIPRSASTVDFENYLPTSPILSSRDAGREHVMVRTYHEPSELEETLFPGGPDIYLVLVTGGYVQVDERKIGSAWTTYPIYEGDWFLTPAGGEPYILRWKSLSSDPLTTLHLHVNVDLFYQTVQHVVERDPKRVILREQTEFQDSFLAHLGLTLQRELQQPAAEAIGKLYADAVWRMCEAFLPLLRQSNAGRIVNVSSEGGSLTNMGGGTPAYSVSKAALNALTRVLAAELAGTSILVNSICPGWVATDMGGAGGRPVAEGAAGIVWAATLPKHGPTGGFFQDEKSLPW
jgi:hypothetical protein